MISLETAERYLNEAINQWSNARSAGSPGELPIEAYLRTVDNVVPSLAQAFAEPDLAGGMQSSTYWHLFDKGSWGSAGSRAVYREIDNQVRLLEAAKEELKALRAYAERPGIPVVYDTNTLLWWPDPSMVKWLEVFQAEGLKVPAARLVVPLVVIGELDVQKYGKGTLGDRAAAAIIALERMLGDATPGEPVELRRGVTLEVRIDPAGHQVGQDADGQILRCAAELHHFNRTIGVRVLSNDTNMRLRAQQMGLKPMRLSSASMKPGSAIGEARRSSERGDVAE